MSAGVILERASSAYYSALDYRAVIETRVSSTWGDSPETKCRYQIAGSRPNLLFTDETILSPIHYQVRLGTDGSSVWGYSPSSKLYVQDSGQVEAHELFHDLTWQHYRFFSRSQELNVFGQPAVIEGRSMLRIRGEPHSVPCIRIRISVPAAGWTEQLWIEESRALIRKSVLQKKEVMETVTTTTLWLSIGLASSVPAPYQFFPPAGAKRTNQLTVP